MAWLQIEIAHTEYGEGEDYCTVLDFFLFGLFFLLLLLLSGPSLCVLVNGYTT